MNHQSELDELLIEQAQADMRIRDAAPELYQQLKIACEWISHSQVGKPIPDWYFDARVSINKAEGKNHDRRTEKGATPAEIEEHESAFDVEPLQ